MAKLPPHNLVVSAIFKAVEARREDWRRDHLGASVIGKTCARAVWYSFRWVLDPKHDGQRLRLFERGDREEAWVIEELKAAGMQIIAGDSSKAYQDDGSFPQFRVSWLNGHIGGGLDGIVFNVPGAEKTNHVLEIKTSNDKRFKVLVKQGVKQSNPEHFVQVQLYMLGRKLKRTLYICVNKNTDEIYVERVQFDKAVAEAALNRAKLVVASDTPLERISDNPTWFECKMCDYHSVCHDTQYETIERNCRSCSESTPKKDGTWFCEHHGISLDNEAQRTGCDDHLHMPQVLDRWKVAGYDKDSRRVIYEAGQGAVVDTSCKLTTVEET